MKSTNFALTATFALALSLTFSCSGGDDGGGEASSGVSSSSSKPSGVSSSSVTAPSSNSTPSSSSVAVSSSSSKPSSSSVPPSSSSVAPSSSSAQVVTSCDMNYRTVVIGTQTWMAENLNCDVSGSKCYNNSEANCDKYGRLYDWATAMGLPSSCNSTTCASQITAKHRGICPSGWHLPSDAEWTTITDFVGGSSTAGTKLKATTGWNENGNGTDEFGFSALPGGYGRSGGSFSTVGDYGSWWSASENGSAAYGRYMGYRYEGVNYDYDDKNNLFSVRCLQD